MKNSDIFKTLKKCGMPLLLLLIFETRRI